jgi:FG-GAP-like repeat
LMLNRTINPGQMSIVREIKSDDTNVSGVGMNNDTAIFQGPSANYSIEGRNLVNSIWAADTNGDGFISVQDSTGVDGHDLLKNIEVLEFTDETIRVGGLAVRNDFSNDGKADILFRDASNHLILWKGNGLNPINLTTQEATIGTVNAASTIAGTGDFNSDGRSDVLLRQTNGDIVLWPGNGLSPATPAATIGSVGNAVGWTVAGTGDFNGDKKADILWQHTNGTIAIWQGNGSAPVTQTAFIGSVGVNSGWAVVGTGDFTADGKSDILWRHTNGSVAIWQGNGLTPVTQISFIGAASNDWQIEGVDDFNADGKSDILWRNANSAIGVWQGNGSTPVTQMAVVSYFDPTWEIAGSGDYNGDGKADMLWRHNSDLGILQLDGLNYVAQGTVIGSTNPSWTISAPKF